MRDQDRRPALHAAAQLFEDALFGVGVHAGQGIVEDQDARIANQRAGEGGALFLTAGESESAFADQRFEAVGELLELAANMRRLRLRSAFLPGLHAELRREMFSRIVSLKRNVSCGTKPMLARRRRADIRARGGRR